MVKQRLWVGLLCLDAAIHVLGFQAAWGIASREEFSSVPAFPQVAPGSGPARLLGTLWLVAAIAFLATAALLLHRHPGWRPAAAVASLLSLGVCLMWWHDAPVGAAVDLLILAGLAVTQVHLPAAQPRHTVGSPAVLRGGG